MPVNKAPPDETSTEVTLKTLYRHMQRLESKLGGGEGYEGIYGSLTLHGMDAVINALQMHCDLTEGSAFVDVGAGLGRPLMHAMVTPGVRRLWGIEVDCIKVQKALAFLRQIQQKLQSEGILSDVETPKFTHSAIEKIASLDDFTHAYSFWEGVPMEGKKALGRLFTASEFMIGLAVVQRAFRKCPIAEMAKLGFHGLELKQSIKVRMSGSGQMFNAYIFRKKSLSKRRATIATFQTPVKPRTRRYSLEVPPAGEVSIVRRSLLSLELKDTDRPRSQSETGCQPSQETEQAKQD